MKQAIFRVRAIQAILPLDSTNQKFRVLTTLSAMLIQPRDHDLETHCSNQLAYGDASSMSSEMGLDGGSQVTLNQPHSSYLST